MEAPQRVQRPRLPAIARLTGNVPPHPGHLTGIDALSVGAMGTSDSNIQYNFVILSMGIANLGHRQSAQKDRE